MEAASSISSSSGFYFRADQPGNIAQVLYWRVVEIETPNPVVFMLQTLILLAQLVGPDLIPPELTVIRRSLGLEAGQDSCYQCASFQTFTVIILTEVVIGVLTGIDTHSLTFPHQKSALIFQDGTKRDIHLLSITALEASTAASNVAMVLQDRKSVV